MEKEQKQSCHVTARSHELQKRATKKNDYDTSNQIRELTL